MTGMRHEFGSTEEPGVLAPSVPWDIGAQSQRQRILGALTMSCAEKTFQGATIADIVENAAISRATFYKHFENKRECFDAAVESFLTEVAAVAVEDYSEADSPAEALREAIVAVLGLLAAKPAYAKLVLIETAIIDPAIIGGYRDAVVETLEAEWKSQKGSKRSEADARIAFGRALVLLAERLAAGHAKELPLLQPELVYAALLPFVGHEDALKNATQGR
jgi:AcrR family transcriptional regulator